MNIQKVKLRGFIGVKKGLGLDEVELDLSGANGLVAFSGPTGIGKTTLMENLQPYPVLASRPGKAVKNHVYLRDSIKELSFIHNGQLFETLLKIDAESGRTEGFITIDGSPQIDGKISDYSVFMQKLFGSPDLFFNSVFCAQNSIKISGLRPAELKALFAEFLGDRLQRLIDQEATAKQCGSILSIRLSETQKSIDRLKENAVDKMSVQMLLEANQDQLNESILYLGNASKGLEDHLKALEGLKNAHIENDKLELKIQSLSTEMKRAVTELDSINSEAKKERDALAEKYRECRASLQEIVELLKNKETIEAAVARKTAFETIVNNLAEKIDATRSESEDLSNEIHRTERSKSDLEKKIYKITSEKVSLENEPALNDVQSRIEIAMERIKDLTRVGTDLHCPDCDGDDFECNSENCEFISKAVDAQVNLPGLRIELEIITAENRAKGKILKDKYDEANILLVKLAQALERGNNSRAKKTELIKAYGKEKTERMKELTEASNLAAKMPEILTAEYKNNELEKAKKEIETTGLKVRRGLGPAHRSQAATHKRVRDTNRPNQRGA